MSVINKKNFLWTESILFAFSGSYFFGFSTFGSGGLSLELTANKLLHNLTFPTIQKFKVDSKIAIQGVLISEIWYISSFPKNLLRDCKSRHRKSFLSPTSLYWFLLLTCKLRHKKGSRFLLFLYLPYKYAEIIVWFFHQRIHNT